MTSPCGVDPPDAARQEDGLAVEEYVRALSVCLSQADHSLPLSAGFCFRHHISKHRFTKLAQLTLERSTKAKLICCGSSHNCKPRKNPCSMSQRPSPHRARCGKLNAQSPMQLVHEACCQWANSSNSILCQTVSMIIRNSTAFQSSKSHCLTGLHQESLQLQNAGFIVTSQKHICMAQHLYKLNHLTVHVIHLILRLQRDALHKACLTAHHHQGYDCVRIICCSSFSIGLGVEVVKTDCGW